MKRSCRIWNARLHQRMMLKAIALFLLLAVSAAGAVDLDRQGVAFREECLVGFDHRIDAYGNLHDGGGWGLPAVALTLRLFRGRVEMSSHANIGESGEHVATDPDPWRG